jgi:hypothetical protein
MSWILPVGLDYADGTTTLPVQPSGSGGTPSIVGTPLPTSSLYIYSSVGETLTRTMKVEEQPGSPHLERAEQCTCEHRLKMSTTQANFYFSVMPRGTVVTDTFGNIWRILSCDTTRMEATTSELHYVMESISFDSPPDDFQVNEVSLDLNILKHPRYAWALNPYVSDASTWASVGDLRIYYSDQKNKLVRMLQNYIEAPIYPDDSYVSGQVQSTILSELGINTNAGILSSVFTMNYPNKNFTVSKPKVNPVGWDGVNANMPTANCPYFLLEVPVNLSNPNDPISIAIAAAKEVITKLWRQEDTPYIAGYEITHTQYFFAPVFLNPGGYIEDPRYIVPAYFMSPYNNGIIPRGSQGNPFGGDTGAPVPFGGTTIFDALPIVNPQCYATNGLRGGPLSFSCLRKSDNEIYQRTWFAMTHTWLCAPVGKWDADIYSQNNRPQNANDFNRLPSSFGN